MVVLVLSISSSPHGIHVCSLDKYVDKHNIVSMYCAICLRLPEQLEHRDLVR